LNVIGQNKILNSVVVFFLTVIFLLNFTLAINQTFYQLIKVGTIRITSTSTSYVSHGGKGVCKVKEIYYENLTKIKELNQTIEELRKKLTELLTQKNVTCPWLSPQECKVEIKNITIKKECERPWIVPEECQQITITRLTKNITVLRIINQTSQPCICPNITIPNITCPECPPCPPCICPNITMPNITIINVTSSGLNFSLPCICPEQTLTIINVTKECECPECPKPLVIINITNITKIVMPQILPEECKISLPPQATLTTIKQLENKTLPSPPVLPSFGGITGRFIKGLVAIPAFIWSILKYLGKIMVWSTSLFIGTFLFVGIYVIHLPWWIWAMLLGSLLGFLCWLYKEWKISKTPEEFRVRKEKRFVPIYSKYDTCCKSFRTVKKDEVSKN